LITGIVHLAAAREAAKAYEQNVPADRFIGVQAHNYRTVMESTQARLEGFRISVRNAESSEMHIRPFRPDQRAIVAVAKTANGIASDITKTIVRDFYQKAFEPK
jgi:hypothetical protein